MKIYIVGSGGVGGYFGGLLVKAQTDVTFVARGEHYKAIKKNGLQVKSVNGDFAINPAQVIESISDIRNPELVIFTVKTYDTKETAKELAAVTIDNSIVITFQNGVGNDIQIKKFVKKGKVYPGIAYVISTKTRPGVIEQTGGMCKLIFGDKDNPSNTRLREIKQIMKEADIDVVVSSDITRDLWNKFIFIAAFSGMTAICRSPIGKVLAYPLTKSIYERCVKETIAVAKSRSIDMADDVLNTIMEISQNVAPDSKSSLLVDVENGRRNEIETLNGTIVRYAKEQQKIDVPINKLIYGAIKLLE